MFSIVSHTFTSSTETVTTHPHNHLKPPNFGRSCEILLAWLNCCSSQGWSRHYGPRAAIARLQQPSNLHSCANCFDSEIPPSANAQHGAPFSCSRLPSQSSAPQKTFTIAALTSKDSEKTQVVPKLICFFEFIPRYRRSPTIS